MNSSSSTRTPSSHNDTNSNLGQQGAMDTVSTDQFSSYSMENNQATSVIQPPANHMYPEVYNHLPPSQNFGGWNRFLMKSVGRL